jgi:hypothetical protein
MMRNFMLILAALLFGGMWSAAYAENDELDELQMKMTNEWSLVRNDRLRDIKTYARLEDGKRYRSFKATVTMKDLKPETLVRVLLDFENYYKWYWQVIETKLLKRVSATEYYIYMVHRAPAGLPDRDVILHATVELQTANKNFVTLKVRTEPDFLPPKPPLVRMIAEDLSFKFTPLEGRDIFVEAEGYVDPGGRVPSWAANFVQHSAPYSVALGAMRMVKKEEYALSREPVPFNIYSYGEYLMKQRTGALSQ